MSIADELNHYAGGLEDAYDAASDMGAVIPANRNLDNLDTAIRTIPQPTVNDGTLTIQKNGTNVATFTANQASNATANISVPTDTGDLTNGAGFITSSSLPGDMTGATSQDAGAHGLVPAPAAGDEDKVLSGAGTWVNQPTVPTVNDATLTITQNGTSAGTFTANASSNVTIALTDTTYTDMTGASSGAAGTSGLVPAPAAGDEGKFLQGDGTWATPTDTTYTAGTNVQISAQNVISATDTTYSAFTGATSSVAGTAGLVPAPTTSDPDKFLKGDGTWATAEAGLVEMAYGESNAWAKFIAAYTGKKIVYCRASSNANPGTGAKTRKAFMAYVNNEDNPTSVEFQYVRSVGSKTSSQPVDQVFVYTLTNANGGTWSVVTRDMAPKLAAGTNASVSYSSGTYTVSATDTTYSDFTGTDGLVAGVHGLVPAPATTDAGKFLKADGTWETVSASGATTLYITDKKNSEVQSYSSYPTQVRIFTDSGYTTDIVSTDLMDLLSAGPVNVIIDAQYGTAVTPGVMVSAFSTSGTSSFHIFTQDYMTQTSGTKIYSFTTSMNISQYTGVQDTYIWNGSGGTPATTSDIGTGILTITRNGTAVDTFSANASANKSIDIDVNNGVLTAWNLVPTADTTAGWRTLFPTDGVYVTFYDGNGSFTNKPSGWGVLTTKISYQINSTTNFEVYQSWVSSGAGATCTRRGNTTGWYGNANDSGSFTTIEDGLSVGWHPFAVTSASQATKTGYLPGRNTFTYGGSGQGGILMSDMPSGVKMYRVKSVLTLNSTLTGKNFGISNLKASTTAYTRWSGILNGTTKAWAQASNSTGTGNYANLTGDAVQINGASIEYTAFRGVTNGSNDWSVTGKINLGGQNSVIDFMTVCTAKDATSPPYVYLRGITASDVSSFVGSLEVFL